MYLTQSNHFVWEVLKQTNGFECFISLYVTIIFPLLPTYIQWLYFLSPLLYLQGGHRYQVSIPCRGLVSKLPVKYRFILYRYRYRYLYINKSIIMLQSFNSFLAFLVNTRVDSMKTTNVPLEVILIDEMQHTIHLFDVSIIQYILEK